jgi:hypothetical protein
VEGWHLEQLLVDPRSCPITRWWRQATRQAAEAGRQPMLEDALKASSVSRQVNISFVERYNATDRHKNGRKGRKKYTYSKDWDIHGCVTWFTTVCYNFCHDHASLRVKVAEGIKNRYLHRSPAMAAGLSDHIWSVAELVSRQSLLTSLRYLGT